MLYKYIIIDYFCFFYINFIKMLTYHVPVLLKDTINMLVTNRDGIYIDLTFGGGGHSKAILNAISPKGLVIAFDYDISSLQEAKKIQNKNFIFINANNIFFNHFLKYYNIQKVHGIFADLGVSSHQLDTPERGFSTRFQGPLDMRMDKRNTLTAKKIINTYPEEKIYHILCRYGEIKNAKKIAYNICMYRSKHSIYTTEQLRDIIMYNNRNTNKNKILSQVYQAFRIEVNQELNNISLFLPKAKELLLSKGRLAIISYHSLEDRIVKHFFKFGEINKNNLDTDLYGNYNKCFNIITKKPITPSYEEIRYNNRSRSAKLRVCEKI